jgi:ubiquitin carboxyl-terminal hydrolase 25/28
MLANASLPEITDVHNAFRFLEPSYNESNQYPDDYVIALAGVKKAENDATYFQEKVAKAVSLIAEHRNSEALRAYLATGEATLTSDDDELANAYRFYGIQDRTAELDIAVLQTQLDLILDDKHETTERQIRATQYFKLLTEHHKEAPQITMEPDYTKPVGLENPSNYCYLHALLQYFNSIETFCDTILNFEQYEQPIDTADTTDLGSIGGQLITPLHVENGRKLVPHLTKLFKTLESTAASYVQAPNGLAAEALIPPPAIIASRPASPPQTELRNGANRSNDENGKTTDDAESSSESETVRGDESSDITLVGDVIMTPESVADEQQMADAATDSETKDPAGANDGNKDDDTDKSSPPNRPPPVPPRPNLEKKESELAEEYRQQDAHQVAGNVIQRTIAAIKPTSIQRDGERQDRVRDLFYGIVQQYCTQKSEKKLQFSPLYDAYQYIHLSKKPKDVQEGLDITYGRETNVPDEDRPEDKAWEAFSVIKHAPPLLQLYLQNRESDYTRPATDYRSARVAHHMLLNESIQLDRYMESNQSRILSLREESWNLRDHLHKLEENRESLRIKFERALAKGKGNQDKNTDLDSDEAFTAICNILKSDAEDDGMDEEMAELMEDLESWTETDRAAKETIEAEIPMTCAKLDALRLDIVDTPEYRYRIFAIFMYVCTSVCVRS